MYSQDTNDRCKPVSEPIEEIAGLEIDNSPVYICKK